MPSPNARNEVPAMAGTSRYQADASGEEWLDDRQGFGSRSIVQLWNRRKGLILAVFLAIMAGVAAWISLSPPTYEAVVKIFVKRAPIETLGGDRDTPAAGADVVNRTFARRSRYSAAGICSKTSLQRAVSRRYPAHRTRAHG
jgi:hypothetical protein